MAEEKDQNTQQPNPNPNKEDKYKEIDKFDYNDNFINEKVKQVLKKLDPKDKILHTKIIDRIHDQLQKRVPKSTLKSMLVDVLKKNGVVNRNRQRSEIEEQVFEVANHVIDNSGVCCLIETGELCLYNGGYYHRGMVSENEVKERVVSYIENNGIALSLNKEGAILEAIKRKTHCSIMEFNANDYIVCLKNGMYDFRTHSFTPHKKYSENPYKSFTQINVTFDRDADCPLIDKFIDEVFGQSRKQLIYEILAYSILPTVKFQKAFLLVGEGSNGKTVFLELLKYFLGEDNYSGVTLQMLSKRFQLANLRGKLANIVDDLPKYKLSDTGIFKQVVTDNNLSSELKFKAEVTFKNITKLYFACNEPPETEDVTPAFWRRWIIIACHSLFKRKLTEEDKQSANTYLADPDLLNKLITEQEISGLFNKCWRAWMDLEKRGNFPLEWDDPNYVESIWTIESNPLKLFIQHCCLIGENYRVDKKELYDTFVDFRDALGVAPLDIGTLTKKLKEFKVDQKTVSKKHHPESSGRDYTGIRLVNNVETVIKKARSKELLIGIGQDEEKENHTDEDKEGKISEIDIDDILDKMGKKGDEQEDTRDYAKEYEEYERMQKGKLDYRIDDDYDEDEYDDEQYD